MPFFNVNVSLNALVLVDGKAYMLLNVVPTPFKGGFEYLGISEALVG